jgi:hypothetical protein
MKPWWNRHQSPIHHPMNPIAYLKGFAWISIVALCCSIFSDFWLPMLLGAVVVTLLVRFAR